MSEPLETREAEEIVKIHDAISYILSGETPYVFDVNQTFKMSLALQVLCWVLNHEHHNDFAEFVEGLFAQMKEDGIELTPMSDEQREEIARLQRMLGE